MYRQRINKIGLAANSLLHRGNEILEYLETHLERGTVDSLEVVESEDEVSIDTRKSGFLDIVQKITSNFFSTFMGICAHIYSINLYK